MMPPAVHQRLQVVVIWYCRVQDGIKYEIGVTLWRNVHTKVQ